ncbi:MAG: ABC transporter ATP-binding protein [Clostridiales bacterium]|nr:ABC transporter ATP-binding protein [Clostridiales bacterium]
MFVEAKDIVKEYQNGESILKAVDHASFSVKQGDICVILGPSGSGKSTLMNIIGALERVTSGDMVIDGIPITSLKGEELIRFRRNYIGFVFQFYNLIQNLTVRENIEICKNLSDCSLDIDTLIEKVGLTEHRDKFPAQLSGGQQQRAAIARALVKNPKLLLCDEPTGALDYKTSKEILNLFEDLNRNYGTTIIMITHNDAIENMAHRIIRIKDGKIVLDKENENRKSAAEISW